MEDPRRASPRRRDSKPNTGPVIAPEAVRVKLLGGFSVSVGPRIVREGEWRLKKAASLVKLLALAPDHRLHREQLMERLWPELDEKAQANNLRQALHVARRALEPAPTAASRHLQLLGDQLALCPEGQMWVDAEAFEAAVVTARRTQQPAAYRAAIDLYAGDLLPEDRYEGWAEERREALRHSYLSLLVELAGLYEERGEIEAATEALGRVVAAEPAYEEAHLGLMRLYALQGRRQEAALQYERLRKVLSEELGEEPAEATRRLYEEIRVGRSRDRSRAEDRAPVAPPAEPARHNLPVERTSFVGREQEMVEVGRLLSMTRLLTLTGAGGSGKTRFAFAVARGLAGSYPDGAWLVEPAPLSEGDLVPQAVAQVLKVREQPGRPLSATLKDHLSSKKLLLVLDNCEHVIEAAARLIETLLDASPGLKVLATSREALNVAGELIWSVPPLSVPDPNRPPTVEELAGSESVRLFVERAWYRDPTFELNPRNAGAVAQICRGLDGIPLAIELAAAKAGVLSEKQIAERLEDSLKLLTAGSRTASPRQRTLRGALDWSFELLSEAEKRLFGRLSVFWGGWALEAAEAVGAGGDIEEDEILELLLSLVDKSLVAVEPSGEGEPRYGMLELVRQYGLERLEESGESDAVRHRHAEHYLALAERVGPKLKGQEQEIWLPRLEAELDNLRAALRWSLDHGKVERIARTAWSSWQFWGWSGHLGEGRRWMEEALARGSGLPASARARLLFVAGTYAQLLADWEPARTMAQESLRLFRQLGDEEGVAYALGTAGIVALGQERPEEGLALLEESVDLNIEVGDKWAASLLLGFTAPVPLAQGVPARARRLAQQALSLAREIGSRDGIYVALLILATVAWTEGNHERAARLFEEGLSLSAEVGEESHVAYFLEGLAAVAASEDGGSEEGLERAARLWGAAEALLEAIEIIAYTYEHVRSLYHRRMDAARSRLDEARWEAAWMEGRSMTLEQAMEYALLEEEEPPTTAPATSSSAPASYPAGLSAREAEVLNLVAEGLTNAQVAEGLFISPRTVERHLNSIYAKLKVGSRASATRFAIEHGLA